MNVEEQLRQRIRGVFGSVPFPKHCGLRAGMEKDNWVSDPDVLAKITADQDLKGEWWQIPDKELQKCFLGAMYLDASGREFYLPAYLTVALNGRNINHYRHAVLLLDVYPEEDDENMRKHLISRLSKIKGEKKQVCIEFLEYVHSRFSDEKRVLNDLASDTKTHNWAYAKYLREDFDELACDANKLLHDKFWAKKGA
jgi:hypothetical protein